MARASTVTHLSLDRFAKIVGLNPVHWNGAAGSVFFPDLGQCDDIWTQYPWQDETNLVSREDVARAIFEAENDIANVLGYPVAPEWIELEYHAWPGDTPRSKTIQTDWGQVIAGGVRVSELIEAGASVAYSDPDGDGFNELATLTVATTVTDARELKVYFAGQAGAPAWEIRPPKAIAISGGNATITFDSWLLFDPALWEALPTSAGYDPINPANAANYVTTVDVYRVYHDTTQAATRFYSSPYRIDYAYWSCPFCAGVGCSACNVTTEDGCLLVNDRRAGLVTPFAATYDATLGWRMSQLTTCRNPNQVSLNYYAGYASQPWLKQQALDPLDEYLAQAIAWIAVARLPGKLCACAPIAQRVEMWQRDLAIFSKDNVGYARFREMDIFSSPFGTRYGEVMAWQRIHHLVQTKTPMGGAL